MNRSFYKYSVTDRRSLLFFKNAQKGVTLIELMVGIALGLMVVAVAIGALMASRGISGTVSEATSLQQQASYAFRVIGQQVRQAGSIELSLNPNIVAAASVNDAMAPVAFDPPDPSGSKPAFNKAASTVTGDMTPSFTIGYQNYTEVTTAGSTPTSLLRDCLGQNNSPPVLSSTFKRNANKNELVCSGTSNNTAQPVIGNVTDFKIRYIKQNTGTTNIQNIQDVTTISSMDWPNVYAIEICLELSGTETTATSNATYIDCSGNSASYGDRLKMVFRNTYQIRSQGQI